MIRSWTLLVLLACGESTADPDPGPAPETSPVDFEPTDEQRAILDAADANDGTVDHVISECARCSLAMDGNASHASQVGDYTLHFCAASCREAFDSDPAEGISDIATSLGTGE